jgi:hypothetical protein
MTSTFQSITSATFRAVSAKQAKKSQRTVVIMWLGAILSLTTLTYAQFPNASVTGQVIDSSKAIIAGAHILAVNVNTNIRYEAATNGAGEYYFPNLLPGSYRMEANMTGFKAVMKPYVVLHVQDAVEIRRARSEYQTPTIRCVDSHTLSAFLRHCPVVDVRLCR